MLNPRAEDAAAEARLRFFSGLHASDRFFVAVEREELIIKFGLSHPQCLHCSKITPPLHTGPHWTPCVPACSHTPARRRLIRSLNRRPLDAELSRVSNKAALGPQGQNPKQPRAAPDTRSTLTFLLCVCKPNADYSFLHLKYP